MNLQSLEDSVSGGLLCARDAALAHPDNELSGPPDLLSRPVFRLKIPLIPIR
jgi:hypothetical protein